MLNIDGYVRDWRHFECRNPKMATTLRLMVLAIYADLAKRGAMKTWDSPRARELRALVQPYASELGLRLRENDERANVRATLEWAIVIGTGYQPPSRTRH